MSKPLVSDALWAAVEPLLPPEPPKPKGGRPRVPGRAAFAGILFVLRSGIPWEMLPPEMGCGSGVTCWRRLRDWQAAGGGGGLHRTLPARARRAGPPAGLRAGVWDAFERTLLDRLGEADRIDWSRASLDSASIPAKRGASASGRTR